MKFLLLSLSAILVVSHAMRISKKNPGMENPDMFQGDIRLPEGSDAKLTYATTVKWPSGILYYTIDEQAGYTDYEKRVITNAMRTVESQTDNCLRFVPRTNESYYLKIKTTNTGCNSYVGKLSLLKQPQIVSLDRDGCVHPNVVTHELLHAAGFEHEQCRPDRDDYINIVWDNILTDSKSQFDKYSYLGNTLNTTYDFYSVMHYRKNAFSKNGLDTIQAKVSGVAMSQVGNRNDLSPMDVLRVKKYYNCIQS